MGRDGAEGLLSLRRCGHHTIAQDQKSSVVFGMPKAAIEAGAAKDILPVNEIGAKIKTLVGK
jgi:two-component system response regulator WspF